MLSTRLVVNILVAAALTALGGSAAAMAGEAKPPVIQAIDVETADVPKLLNELAERYQPTGKSENAYAALIDAVKILDAATKAQNDALGEQPDFTLLYDSARRGELSDQQKSAMRGAENAIAAAEAGGIDAALNEIAKRSRAIRAPYDSKERLAELTAFGVPDPEEYTGRMLETLLPELGKMRQLARFNAARMERAAAAGEWQKFVTLTKQTLSLGRVAAHQTTLIDRLVGIAIASLTLDRVRTAVREHPVPMETLVELRRAIDAQTSWPSPAVQLEGEWLAAMDTCRWAFEGNGADAGLSVKEMNRVQALASGEIDLSNTTGFAGRGETVEFLNSYYRAIIATADMTRAERAVDPEFAKFAKQEIPGRLIIAQILVPATGKVFQSEDQIRTDIGGTRIILAAEAFQRKHGRYPASVDEVKEMIVAAGEPKDRFATDGSALRYKKLDAKDASGREYLVYSVGANSTDDGGVPPKSGVMFEALRLPDGDFVVNRVEK